MADAAVGLTKITTSSVSVPVSVLPTLTASAYPTVAVVGGKLSFPNAFGPALTGVLTDVRLVTANASGWGAALELWLFASTPQSTFADHVAPTTGQNTADLAYGVLVDRIPLSVDATSLMSAMTLYRYTGSPRQIWSQSTTMSGVLVCTAAITPASTSDIAQLSLGILQD